MSSRNEPVFLDHLCHHSEVNYTEGSAYLLCLVSDSPHFRHLTVYVLLQRG